MGLTNNLELDDLKLQSSRDFFFIFRLFEEKIHIEIEEMIMYLMMI